MPLDFDALVLAPAHATFGEVNRGFPIPLYTPKGWSAFAINGVFRLPSATDAFGLSDAPGVTTRKPEFDLRQSQLPAGVVCDRGDQVEIRGVTYSVTDVRPDGDGLISLELVES